MISSVIGMAVERVLRQMAEGGGDRRPDGLKIVAERPANPEHGDYSINVAMQLARAWRRPPMVIAGDLCDRLRGEAEISGLFAKVEAAAPGFVNLYLDYDKWLASVFEVPSRFAGDGKVLIEHTSINPNKAAHIGHLRNSCIGDTLARLLKRTGHRVEVHNYIDDLGNQLADTLVGLLYGESEADEKQYARFGDYCWDVYSSVHKAFVDDPILQLKRAEVLHELERGSGSIAWLGLLTAERIVREHLEEMKPFGIGYDVLVWENAIVREGFWERAFELLKATPVFRLETEGKLSGCWVLKQAGEDGTETLAAGDQEHEVDKVLVRSNGVLTYTAKDIAYHLWKFGVLGKEFRYVKFADRLWSTHTSGVRKSIGRAETVINVIDHRQEYPQTMVKQALQALGFPEQAERLKHVGYGVVSLSRATAAGLGVDTSDGKSSYPMSGRQGIGIRVAELLDRMEGIIDGKRSRKAGLSSRAIAAASIRYYLLRFHLQTEIVFDLEQATELSGNTGVYLLYSYARACSVIEKAGSDGAGMAVAGEATEQERALMRTLAYWPETLHRAAAELAPNTVCAYAHELATLFNHFYASCPILKAEDIVKRDFRLRLTSRFKETLRDALDVLGLPAPRRM
ncbi:arginine--tRNA ligase [Paenibacillus ginsengarvi]|uniref:Arginine--tRNA ligase n=1 Tax=Paenibacillus ginsengarvi TaxID=400777 RepID=A0A3B0BNY0_9BACL|nr:arginine--tRNA ligase [Paenibacillus ginsengarvi]RKN73036.1 arginine--tRNA ligase [Paenibacillus ginsengarvi]